MIQRAYNADFDRMGKRFAIGDGMTLPDYIGSLLRILTSKPVIAQNEMQAQIIQLQQTVISILEDAVYTGRKPSRADMATLFKASEAAREGTINALNGQYKRLLDNAPMRRALPPAPSAKEQDMLYCRYSFALQDAKNMPLSRSFAPGEDCVCHRCGREVPIEPNRAWQIYVDDPNTRRGERTYHLLNRFIVKCHRANGEFACILCSRFRKVDTVWEDVKGLAKHIARAHNPVEIHSDIDIKEVG
jgi:hypothetical protein